MRINRCFGCMAETESYPCPHCGYDPAKETIPNYILPPGSVLQGRYFVGKMLGQGGFGITYVGWDTTLNVKIAIKEFYPSGQVTRHPSSGSKLLWNSGEQSEDFRRTGMDAFLKEARKMVRVAEVPEVVKVLDTFCENETAYIVMEYADGESLLARLTRDGAMSWENAKEIFLPVLDGMEKVHKAGLIHRDLSPDNLMLTPDGKVKILDLGAAKDLTINTGASSMLVAKGGFSPVEQYTQHGGSGTWTDVYALAATIYYTLTGVIPPTSIDRIESDSIQWNLPQLTKLPRHVLTALKEALTVPPEQRTQTMTAFRRALMKKQRRGTALIAVATAAVLVICAAGAYFALKPNLSEPVVQAQTEAPTEVPTETSEETTEPATQPETTEETTVPETEPETQEATTAPTQDTVPTYQIMQEDDFSRYDDTGMNSLYILGSSTFQRKRIVSITFHSSTDDAPDNAWHCWDVSAAGDRSVLAWVDEVSVTELHFGANGKISLGENAQWLFAAYPNLQSINFNGCVDTSQVKSMANMFYGDENLYSISLDGFDMSNVETTEGMFQNCACLMYISLTDKETAKLTTVSSMFEGCENLRSVDMSGFDTSGVTDFSYMFADCTRLSSATLPLNTENATTFEGMFQNCSSIGSVTLSFSTGKVNTMAYMFSGCTYMTSVDLSSFDTSSVTTMSHMFYNCESLQTLDVSGFDTFQVTDMNSMFSGCTSLEDPDLSSFDFTNVSDYSSFMDYGKTINGRSWSDYFWENYN